MHPYGAIWLASLPQNPFYILLAIIALSCVGLGIWRELQINSALNSLRSCHYDRALWRLERLERFHLTHTALLFHKATVLLLAARNQEAEKLFRRCLKSPESTMQQSLILVNLGYVLLEQKRYAESAQALDEAIRMRPEGATAYSTRAEVFLRQGIEPERALELLDRGIQYKQATARQRHRDVHVLGYLHANRAWALFLLGRPAEAERALEEAEESLQEAMAAERFKPCAAGIRYRKGRALLVAGDATRAQEEFRQSCEIDPDGKYAALSRAASGQGG